MRGKQMCVCVHQCATKNKITRHGIVHSKFKHCNHRILLLFCIYFGWLYLFSSVRCYCCCCCCLLLLPIGTIDEILSVNVCCLSSYQVQSTCNHSSWILFLIWIIAALALIFQFSVIIHLAQKFSTTII